VLNPQTGELFLGALGRGVMCGGRPAAVSARASLDGALVLASRSEVSRGEWDRFCEAPFTVRPVGSVAYKLALVAAGQADATWTLVPKHEWDVAAGAALVTAGGGQIRSLDGGPLVFNRSNPLFAGLVASSPDLSQAVWAELGLVAALE